MYLIKHNKSIFSNYNEVRALLYCFGEQSHKFIENTCIVVSSDQNAMFVSDIYRELRILKRSYGQSRNYLNKLVEYKLATIVKNKVFFSPFLFSNISLTVTFESKKLTVSKGIHSITLDCPFDNYLCFLRNTLTKRTLSFDLFKLILNSFDENGEVKKTRLTEIALDNNLNKDTLNQIVNRYFKSHLFINKDRHTVQLDQNLLSLKEIKENEFDKHTFSF
ncbi:hypothetical protein C408_1436 [Vibrio diabolicus E0666]|uniref:hypothetical protein n=1 Tax=Vibrio diabolicus TaxID=50719 RepID=UPI0002B70E3B|nr:hypothetical protein [Vibrio diabolicus]EMD80220.1 hypothetical protein C408_1436 [Vibrio diabolicus E0666]